MLAGRVEGQARVASALLDTALVVTAEFPVATVGLDWTTAPWLRVCQDQFENAVVAHPNVSPVGPDTVWKDAQFSPTVISTGERCLQRLGGSDTFSSSDWGFLQRFAAALNDDTLFQHVVTRQLTAAGVLVRTRATILKQAIHLLVDNLWDEVDTGAVTVLSHHRTAAHAALARRYAEELDTMRPAGAVLRTRMEVYEDLVKLDQSPWSADSQLTRAQYRLHLAQSVPLAEIPTEDQSSIRQAFQVLPWRVAEAQYLVAPTHENLTHVVMVRDSVLGKRLGLRAEALLGQPAPRLIGDYWFHTPGSTPPTVPTPGRLSLIVFIDPVDAQRAIEQHDLEAERRFATLATRLTALHTRYPGLQMILVTMTEELAQRPDKPDDPQADAALIDTYVTRLGLPGMLCVLQSRYHTEPGMTAIPLASPMLDGFHLDPRSYGHQGFLIDTSGWIVDTHLEDILTGHLLQRLVLR